MHTSVGRTARRSRQNAVRTAPARPERTACLNRHGYSTLFRVSRVTTLEQDRRGTGCGAAAGRWEPPEWGLQRRWEPARRPLPAQDTLRSVPRTALPHLPARPSGPSTSLPSCWWPVRAHGSRGGGRAHGLPGEATKGVAGARLGMGKAQDGDGAGSRPAQAAAPQSRAKALRTPQHCWSCAWCFGVQDAPLLRKAATCGSRPVAPAAAPAPPATGGGMGPAGAAGYSPWRGGGPALGGGGGRGRGRPKKGAMGGGRTGQGQRGVGCRAGPAGSGLHVSGVFLPQAGHRCPCACGVLHLPPGPSAMSSPSRRGHPLCSAPRRDAAPLRPVSAGFSADR